VPELVTDGVDGLTFPKKDAVALANRLERVVQDPAMRAAFASAAARTARDSFAIEMAVKRLQNLYLSFAR